MNERFSSNPEKSPESGEQESISLIRDLLDELEFASVEAEETWEKRGALVEQLATGEGFQEMAAEYHILIEEEINKLDGKERETQQLALSINMALIWLESGNLDECLEELNSAAESAGYFLPNMVDAINSVVDKLSSK